MAKRIAVITGGAGGMGMACARQLGGKHRLLLADFDAGRLSSATEQLAGEGFDLSSASLDVSYPEAVRDLGKRSESLGELGALVHTAGLSPTMADGARIWSVNLVGSAYLMETFRPLARAGSAAVLVASQAGHFFRAGATAALEAVLDDPLAPDLPGRIREIEPGLLEPGGAYGGSKYGVIRMAVRESVAWGAVGGRVISLSPGIIDTSMGQQEYAQQPAMAMMVDKTPLRRMGRADEIASAVTFLCSEAASFVTGTDLLVDGGSTEAVRGLLGGAAST